MWELIEAVSGFLLGLAIVTPFLLKAKRILKEVGELLTALSDGLADNSLSHAEVKNIIKEAGDVIGIFKK